MSFFGGAIKGFYQAVKNVFADNGAPRIQVDAYGNIETAEYNRALGAAQITDISPVLLARLPVTVRASAVLPAAGAEDVPIEIPTGGMGYLVIQGVYTRGAVGGGFQLRVQICDTVAGVDYWAERVLNDAGVFAAGTPAVDGGARRRYARYAETAEAEGARDILIHLGGADKVRIYAREIGVVGTPGTLAIYGKFSNQPINEPVPADSKSYTPATDSKRIEEISPLSQQFVTEQLALLADLDTGTFYYPSAAGGAMGGYKDLGLDFEMTAVAGGTIILTVESTNNDVTPTWFDITRSGYLMTNPAGGGLANYTTPVGGSLNGSLDFDNLNRKLFRIKIVASNDNNTVLRLFIRRKAL